MTVANSTGLARPPFDAQLAAVLAAMPEFPAVSDDSLPMIRPYSTAPIEPLLEGRAVARRETTAASADGTELAITVLSPETRSAAVPGVLWLHGGGMVMGDRFSQIDIPLEWLDRLGAVIVTIDYRLAPEAKGRTIVEDGYAGLLWLAEHADELGVDPSRIVVAGTSAGGGIAAGVTLLARDRQALAIAAQMLICPMLDHRDSTVSTRQFTGPGVWSRESNLFAWSAVLGDATAEQVPIYVSPATATDLSGLPTTFIDAGSAEVFRDEDVDYAARIWAAGGQAELHIWAGGFHGFDALDPNATVSRAARTARIDWLQRVLTAD